MERRIIKNKENIMRISLVYLGTEGGGPVYCYEMAKALLATGKCILQVIVSKRVTNLNVWQTAFSNVSNVEFIVLETYSHNKLSVALSFLNYPRMMKVVHSINNFHPNYVYFPHGLMWSGFVYSRIHKNSKIIITLHDPRPHNKLTFTDKCFRIINSNSKNYVDYVAILNQRDFKYVSERTSAKVFVMPHANHGYYAKGVDVHSQFVNPILKRKILFTGEISNYKGVDLLVDAFEKLNHNDVSLTIAGKGIISESLLQRIKHNEKITLINRYIADEEFPSLIGNCDFLVLPYRSATQSGVIPLAFAFGKTVVATNVGALSEQIPERTGILTKVDPTEIARAIDMLYDNPQLIYEYGKKALSYSETEMSWDKSAEILLNSII